MLGLFACGAALASPVAHQGVLLADGSARSQSLVEKGERHAGNNFFQALLRYNFPNVTDHTSCDQEAEGSERYFCCWTHGYASDACAETFDPPLTAMILVVRNPYAWLAAMHTEPYEHDGMVAANMSKFLRTPFSYSPQQYPSQRDVHANPVALWIAKVESYLSLNTTRHVIITHDDLYNPDALTTKLRPLTKLGGFYAAGSSETMRYDQILDSATNAKMSGEFSRSAFERARIYERERRWLSYFTDDDLAFINEAVGEHRMRSLGFETLRTVAIRSVRKVSAAAQDHKALCLLDHSRWTRV